MPTITTSSNMLLPVPIVGADLGPQYAVDINSCLSLIDSHDHSTGKGVQITQAGINITGDVAFNGFNATLLKTARFSAQGAVLSGASDLGCAYVVSNDLYFNDGLGNQIRMTQSGGVAGTPGSIAGLVAPASATYIPASTKFVWQSAVNTSADMDCGSVIIRQNTASANGITLSSPAALASAYSLTLFPSLPATKRQVMVDSSGNLTAEQLAAVDDAINYTVTATVAANALTISLKTIAGTDPSATDQVRIAFRSATATSGSFNLRTVSAATSMVVSSGSTLGQSNATSQYIYVYAIDNGGTVELAVSSTLQNDRVVGTTTAEGGAGGADSATGFYSTTARSSVPIRLIARLTSNQTTAGTWAAVPTAITLLPDNKEPVNYAVSSAISFSTSSTSYVAITNASVSIVTSGRPVMVFFANSSGNHSFSMSGNATASTITQIGFQMKYIVDGVDGTFLYYDDRKNTTSGSSAGFSISNNFVALLTPNAGAHTITASVFINTSNVTSPGLSITSKLVAYEL